MSADLASGLAHLPLPSLTSLHWLRPQWLWALALLPLLAWWWRARHRQDNVWREVVDPHLLAHLLDGATHKRAHAAIWSGVLAGALAIGALAGPSWQRSVQPLWQTSAPLVIALDLSSATLATDLPPSRLLQARAKIADLLRRRAGGQVGLVAFADDAFTVAPLTDDVGNVALFLDSLEPDIMPVDGSNPDRAIAWSARLLQQAGFNHGDILLLTDHASTPARHSAAAAADAGYRVSVLGLGTPTGAAYRDADGSVRQARLDAASLRALATSGGGAYAALSAGDADLAALGVLDPQHAATTAMRGEKTQLWRDQGYWLLPPLMLLALFAFRRGGALAMLLLCLGVPWQPARAAGGDWWRRADQQANVRQEQGVVAYRNNHFSDAAQHWKDLPGADAAYNRGNAVAKQGDYDAAIAAYDQALRLQPAMADAIANRKAVMAAKKRKPPAGKQKDNPNGKPSQRPQDKSDQQPGTDGSQGKPKGDQPSPGQQQAPQKPQNQAGQQQQPSSAQQAAPPKAGDPESQRDADAAQRQRMQQALEQGKPHAGGDRPTSQPRPETPAQRERRLANEAWLRRVPDDPGGLLRAKFQLEYERRQGDR